MKHPLLYYCDCGLLNFMALKQTFFFQIYSIQIFAVDYCGKDSHSRISKNEQIK